MSDVLLDVKNVKKYFKTPKGILHAVDDVTFSINRGETLGMVGESGCGKSTTGRVVLRLLEPTEGSIILDGEDISKLSEAKLRSKRKEMQMIFQDPLASLDPRKTVGQIIEEPLRIHNIISSSKDRQKRVLELMETVGLAQRYYSTYPHELDGGRDEPVSALDVSIQAQILNLLEDLQKQMGLTYMFITHDLSVVHHFSDNIAVMYLGKIIELAPSDELFAAPTHPYTQALLSAIPVPKLENRRERIILKGEITSPINLPKACRFASRCIYATEQCLHGEPELKEVAPGHKVACYRAESTDKT